MRGRRQGDADVRNRESIIPLDQLDVDPEGDVPQVRLHVLCIEAAPHHLILGRARGIYEDTVILGDSSSPDVHRGMECVALLDTYDPVTMQLHGWHHRN